MEREKAPMAAVVLSEALAADATAAASRAPSKEDYLKEGWRKRGVCSSAPQDHINIRILQTMISAIPLILGLETKMSDPYVYVVFWAPM